MKSVYLIVIGMFLICMESVFSLVSEVLMLFGFTINAPNPYPFRIINGWCGDYFSPETILVFIGFVFVFIGCFKLRSFYKTMAYGAYCALGAGVCYVFIKMIPTLLDRNYLIVTLIAVVVRVLIEALMVYFITIGVSRQVDGYLNMETRQDLMFGFQIYAMSLVVANILAVARLVNFFRLFYVLGIMTRLGACVYYPVKLQSHSSALKIFSKSGIEQTH